MQYTRYSSSASAATPTAAAAAYNASCHHYLTYSFDHGDLGFTAAPMDPNKHLLLGNVVVVEVKPNSQAERAGLCVLDALVCVNGEYLAFSTPQSALSKLAIAANSRPVSLTFARPVNAEWLRIGNSTNPDQIVRSGELEKQGRLFRRSREFVLTRTALSYSEEGYTTTKKRIPVEEITRMFPSDSNRLEFTYVYQQSETVLRASTREECIAWMHAIETVKRGCFEDVTAALSRLERANKTAVAAAATTTTAARVAPPAPKLPPAPAIQVSTSPYAMLSKCRLVVNTSETNKGASTATTRVQLPPKLQAPSPPPSVDLSLERKLLASAGKLGGSGSNNHGTL